MRRWLLYIFLLLSAGLILIFYINELVGRKAAAYLSSDLSKLPHTKVAVLLGTSRYLSDGSKNLYFEYRMDAAAELYKSGKVEYILVSGDNRQENYNEPRAMLKALIERGVPENHVVMDYAGFRTLDSMVRAKEVFDQDSFIVVSQRFHNERAIYIALHKGIKAYGYNARDVDVAAGFMTRLREVLARTKMMLDLYVLRTQPHFLGEKVKIGQ